MRIGIAGHSLNSIDGAFHYELAFLSALREVAQGLPEELVYIASAQHDPVSLAGAAEMAAGGLQIPALQRAPPEQLPPEAYLGTKPSGQQTFDLHAFYCDREAALYFRDAGIDLLLMPGPYDYAFSWLKPFVTSVYDLNHRLQPEFPEVSAFGEYDRREFMYSNICRYATFVLVDSEVGKEDLLRFYGHLINDDRIRILPYHSLLAKAALPGPRELARVAAKYQLPARFFFILRNSGDTRITP